VQQERSWASTNRKKLPNSCDSSSSLMSLKRTIAGGRSRCNFAGSGGFASRQLDRIADNCFPCAFLTRNFRPLRCGPSSRNSLRGTVQTILQLSGGSRLCCAISKPVESRCISMMKRSLATSCRCETIKSKLGRDNGVLTYPAGVIGFPPHSRCRDKARQIRHSARGAHRQAFNGR
jgi:hypothetical protein